MKLKRNGRLYVEKMKNLEWYEAQSIKRPNSSEFNILESKKAVAMSRYHRRLCCHISLYRLFLQSLLGNDTLLLGCIQLHVDVVFPQNTRLKSPKSLDERWLPNKFMECPKSAQHTSSQQVLILYPCSKRLLEKLHNMKYTQTREYPY